MALHPGDLRLLDDLGEIDDRGLEYAEDLIHELRHRKPWGLPPDDRIDQALAALNTVRTLTRRG